MRISDWSSDVCSSDLLAQVMFDRLAGVKTTYVPFKGTGAAVTALLGKQVAAEWGYTSVGASHRDQVRMLAVAMDERHPQFPDRSEEHTSELQSLMRISYAVFCLKKRNKA